MDVTLRDGHQSLWATRMTNAMMLPFVPRMDDMGFDWINLVGGAVFDVCVRFLREDPWQRMRLVKERAPNTPIDVMTRGQSLYTFEMFADDVVELTMRRIRANGMERVTIYDALNDTRNLGLSIEVAREEGLYVAAGVVYTISPVHTDDFYRRVARELVGLGADAIFLKDQAGLLTPDRVRTLVPALADEIRDVPLELHSHSLSGLAEQCYLEAVPLGVDLLCTASLPLASGASLPPTAYCVKHLAEAGFESRLSLDELAEMDDYFTGVAKRHGKPIAVPHRYDPALYRHQVPGGMISNLHSQLAEYGMSERLGETLEEAEQVRVDLGYPILVSPFAQYVIAQSLLNVVQGERYKTIPVEVRRYALGLYGRPAAPVNQDLLDRIVEEDRERSEPMTERPGEHIAPALPALREKRGPFESDDDLLLAAFYTGEQLEPLFEARLADDDAGRMTAALGPVPYLLAELGGSSRFDEVSIEKSGLRLRLRK